MKIIGRIVKWTFGIIIIANILLSVFGARGGFTGNEEDNAQNKDKIYSDIFAMEGLRKKGYTDAQLDSIRSSYNNLYLPTDPAPCKDDRTQTVFSRQWEDSKRRIYKGAFTINNKQACYAEAARERLPYPADRQYYWGIVYSHLFKNDFKRMPEIYKAFEHIRREKKLNYQEFAEVIITYIQNIPYVLVHPGSCSSDRKRNTFSEEYHTSGRECLSHKRYGIQGPSEFMYNLKGDCDTRAVFAYTVLTHFGYDVVVLGSERHAMLGINIKGQGNYLVYQGKKYYFWETTGTGWVLGTIPPTYQNDNWIISLHSIKGLKQS